MWGEDGIHYARLQTSQMRETSVFHIFIKWVLALSVVLATASVGFGQDFEKGLAAAKRGDFATALGEWQPLAEQGDTDAQYNLGVMYEDGRGVIQDNVYAHMWWNIAASQGDADAVVNRETSIRNRHRFRRRLPVALDPIDAKFYPDLY